MAAARADGKLLHVLFLPYMANGHLIPLVNAARLFASRGVNVTILTTPSNASLFRSSIDSDVRNFGHSISVTTLRFPSAEVGLPEGIENFSTITSPEMGEKVFYAMFLLQKPLEDKIRELSPDCIFSDMLFPWTVQLAQEMNIPRILFNQSSYMYNCILQNIKLYKPHQHSAQSFLVPDLPDKIEFKLSQLTDDLTKSADQRNPYDDLLDQMRDSEDRSYGIVHDTFYDLEPAYADYYKKLKKQTKCWDIGPISLIATKILGEELISNDNIDNVEQWLNRQKPKSVLYVSFGSLVIFSDEQLREIARALEASSVPFIWVLRKHQETTWLPDVLKESNTSLLIKGWAPQKTILNHPATGAFMTHCGWNSVLEALTAGMPMLTWPLLAEQFYNEKFVEVSGLGVKVGSEVWNQSTIIVSPVLPSEKIKESILRLMVSGSEETQQIRDKAKAMGDLVKKATEEGQSSSHNLTALIDHISNFNFSST